MRLCFFRHTLARLVAPMMVRTRDYVDEQGPKYRFYSFFLHAKYLVTWPRVIFATITSFLVAAAMYGPIMASYLISAVMLMAFFSGQYAGKWVHIIIDHDLLTILRGFF